MKRLDIEVYRFEGIIEAPEKKLRVKRRRCWSEEARRSEESGASDPCGAEEDA